MTEKKYSGLGKEELRQLQRNQQEKARSIDLNVVFVGLGCQVDERDKFQWRTSTRERISVDRKNPQKFYNHDQQKGGYGAIDLAMNVGKMDFKEAMRWLGQEAPKIDVVNNAVVFARREAIKAVANNEIPKAEPLKWNHVRDYLIQTRKIDATLVDSQYKEGFIYADKYRNAVFLSHNKASAELRGTGSFPYHGARGEEKFPFYLKPDNTSNNSDVNKIAFVESAIEAMSYRALGFQGGIVGFPGQSKEKALSYADRMHSKGYEIIAAYNDDSAGDKMSKNLIDHMAERQVVVRDKPVTNDWNDDLKAAKGMTSYREATLLFKKYGGHVLSRENLAQIEPMMNSAIESKGVKLSRGV